jgi:hypothetical protein
MSFLFNQSAATSSTTPQSVNLESIKKARSLLTSLPSGAPRSRRKEKRVPGLAQDGQYVAKYFNEVAARPNPHLGISTEQQIMVTMTQSITVFLTTSTTIPVVVAQQFALSNFDNYTEYTGLFDQYMIQQIEVWLEPQNPASNQSYGELAMAIDLDDASVGTISSIQNKQGCMWGNGSSGRYMRFRPHVAVAVYSGAFTSFANEPSCWIDCASPSVQHYGLKVGTLATAAAIVYSLTIRAVVSFRAPGI